MDDLLIHSSDLKKALRNYKKSFRSNIERRLEHKL